MDLYLLRHGDAADRETGGYARDEDRPLTEAGRVETRQAARALAGLGVACDLLLTSPLTRAAQTATIAAAVLRPARGPELCAALAPGGVVTGTLWPRDPGDPEPADTAARWEAVLAATAASGPARRVLLVGHMPDLGELAGWLIWGRTDTAVWLRTAGLCRITTPDPPARGTGDLRWLLPPRLLRQLG